MIPLLTLTCAIACGQSVPSDTLVVSSDPELRELAATLLPSIAARSGLELREPVRVEWRTEAELTSYLVHKMEEELPGDEADRIRDSYALLGLVPADLDLRALFLDIYTEQVAGFYDPDSTALFVMTGQADEALETVLIHELVHAVQDQAADLAALTSKELGNDRQVAAQAAIEGHATLVMFEYMAEKLQGTPVDLAALPNFSATLRPALAAMTSQSVALARAPRIVQESIVFPYVDGAGFVQDLWRRNSGRPAPFGDHLPASTEQILDPDRLLGSAVDSPVDLEIHAEDARLVSYTNSLGQAGVRVLLEELLGEGRGAAANGWDGDQFALLGPAGRDRSLVWFSVWDDEPARDAFVALGDALTTALGGNASLEARALDGLPAAVLTVGSVDGDLRAQIADRP